MSLPTELLEDILVTAVATGSHESIARFALVSKQFHALVYRTEDGRLWRQLFIAVFDDPRPTYELISRHATGDACDISATFDWRGELKKRVLAKRFLVDHAKVHAGRDIRPDEPSLHEVLQTLLGMIVPLGPLFPLNNGPVELIGSITPSFPPLVLLFAAPVMHPKISEYNCNSGKWFDELMSQGYPSILTQRLMGAALPASLPVKKSKGRRTAETRNSVPEDVPLRHVLDLEWEETEEGRAFYKLVFMKGFIPSPIIEEQPTQLYSLRVPGQIGTPDTIEEGMQTALARATARRKVFNMRYLSSNKCWGPFRPMEASTHDAKAPYVSPASVTPEQMDRIFDAVNGDTEEEEEEQADASNSAHDTGDENVEEDEAEFTSSEGSEDGDDDGDNPHLLHLFPPAILFPDHNESNNETAIFPEYPHLLKPDYAFLASARMVIEENIRSRLPDGEDSPTLLSSPEFDPYRVPPSAGSASERMLKAMKAFDGLRMGSAPAFWGRGWHQKDYHSSEDDTCPLDDRVPELPGTKHKALYKQRKYEEDPDGWDWAGVAGEWRRCVCWMDYRDLLFHNVWLLRHFNDNAIITEERETIRVFPMTLRVVGYEKAPKPPPSTTSSSESSEEDLLNLLAYRLPIIHIEGEARGSDRSDSAGRKMWGTVRMIGDGAVRWSLVSSEVDATEDEWTSESIQIGSIGSAAGILGLWTGAGHERSDPLGPTWAWKIR